jgi:cytochrome P450
MQHHSEFDPAGFDWQSLLAPNALDEPYDPARALLEECPPLFFSQTDIMGKPGVWIATRFDVIREIFQNTDHYSSQGLYPYFRPMGIELRAIPIEVDPPEHGKYRKLLDPWFSPKAVMALEPRIFDIVTRLIDGFAGLGECDVAHDFGRVYPVKVFMQLMGFPEERFEDFLAWSHPMHFEFANFERMSWGAGSALAYMREFVEQVRSRPPEDTVASRIVHGEIDGRPLSEDEIVGTIFFLWDGGMDTVAATSSLIFRKLALDPELQQLLRTRPDRMANAIEEFLRMNPTVNTARIAKADHRLAGHDIKAGDRLLCMVAAGNFDPDKYDDPRAFRLDRQQNRHLTFVAGPHRCLGINLARFELQIATTEFLGRIPTFGLQPGADRTVMPGLLGAPHVPIVWPV